MTRRLMGAGFLIAAIIVVAFVLYQNSRKKEVPLVFSPTQMLSALWGQYRTEYLEPSTFRTLDKARENTTTSEGESYTMLRAVWMGDKETFDRSWQWTKDNLQHTNDHLFSWLFGKREDGSYGIRTDQGGGNAASDGDTDIALALLFAYARWQDPQYLTEARAIINDIWRKEVIVIDGTPYMTADDLENTSRSPYAIVNPSYLAPYAYRIFAKADTAHPWQKVVDSSYALIEKSMREPLDTPTSANLPPNWIRIDKKTGAISRAEGALTTDFGYDAFRTLWRLALDWQWNSDPRAERLLKSTGGFLATYWKEHQMLPAGFTHDGRVAHPEESPAVYGGVIGSLAASESAVADEVYQKKLVSLYNPDTNGWKDRLSYYDSNWAWFGIALYNNLLPDLPASAWPTAFTRP